MDSHRCKHCAHYKSEVVGFNDEPLETNGWCDHHHKYTEWDDYCNSFKRSAWSLSVEFHKKMEALENN